MLEEIKMKNWFKFFLSLVLKYTQYQIITLLFLFPFMFYSGQELLTIQEVGYCVISILALLAFVSAFIICVNPELKEYDHEPYDWMGVGRTDDGKRKIAGVQSKMIRTNH
jgi:hypothetical protein